jgi:hypothetical protein
LLCPSEVNIGKPLSWRTYLHRRSGQGDVIKGERQWWRQSVILTRRSGISTSMQSTRRKASLTVPPSKPARWRRGRLVATVQVELCYVALLWSFAKFHSHTTSYTTTADTYHILASVGNDAGMQHGDG